MEALKNKAAPIALSLVMAGASLVTTQPVEMVQVCADHCLMLTVEEYGEMKAGVVARTKSGAPIDVEDWQAFAAILDAEIKRNGGLEMPEITSEDELRQAVIKFLEETPN